MIWRYLIIIHVKVRASVLMIKNVNNNYFNHLQDH